jgi:hypothetical protein
MTHLRTGNKVNWTAKPGSIPVEVTIIGNGREGDRIAYDLDNGHWAWAHQLTNRAMDRALAEVDELYAKWEAERPGSVAEFWGVKTRIMEGGQI